MLNIKLLTIATSLILGASFGYVEYWDSLPTEEMKIKEEELSIRIQEMEKEIEKMEEKKEIQKEEDKNEDPWNDYYIDLWNGYYKDEENIYSMWKLLEWADIETFEVIYEAPNERISRNYAKDKNNIYFGSIPVKNIDIESFEIISGYYFKDKNWVYWDGKLDSKETYSQDYIELTKLEDADPETFEIIKLYYAKDKENIYFYDWKKLEWVDTETFEVFGDRWWEVYARDRNYVYFQWIKHSEVDRETFELLYTCGAYSPCFARDKNHVYSMHDLSIIEWFDGATFEYLDHAHQKDKNNVHFRNKTIEWADPETFEVIGKCPKVMWAEYSKDKNFGYINGNKVENSDWKTFEVLEGSCEYAKDKNNLYYRWEILENADFESFEDIWQDRKEKETCENKGSCYEYYDFSKDKNNCYKNAEKVEMSECEDFLKELEMCKYNNYNSNETSKSDEKNEEVEDLWKWYQKFGNVSIYYNWKLLKWAEAESFKVLENNYFENFAEDKNNIYLNWTALKLKNIKKEEIDVWTLELITEFYRGWWLKDKNNIYFKEPIEYTLEKLNNADLENFTPLSYWYAKDKNKVFYQGKVLTYQKWSLDKETWKIALSPDKGNNADIKTFEVNWSGWTTTFAKDKNHIFINGFMIENADLESFQNLSWNDFFRDKNRCYYMEYEISWADLKSFENVYNLYSKDKNNVYYQYKKLEWANPEKFQVLEDKEDYWMDEKNCYREDKVVDMSECEGKK